ncbi:MAG: hypothetical protein ACETVZ_07755 [Phycisphaerae bacterium]
MAELARFRTRFLLILIAARTNRWNRLVINTFCPYRIHHLDKLTGYFDITAVTIFLAAVGNPVKNSTPSATGTHCTVSGLNKGPFKCPVAPETQMASQRRMPGIILTGVI